MTIQLSWDTLEKVILNAENWPVASLILWTDKNCDIDEIGCYPVCISKRQNQHIVYYGPVGWCGADLDDFAFDIYEVRTDNIMNSKKILENIKQMALKLACDKDEQEFKDLRLNGLFVDENCGWEKVLDNIHTN